MSMKAAIETPALERAPAIAEIDRRVGKLSDRIEARNDKIARRIRQSDAIGLDVPSWSAAARIRREYEEEIERERAGVARDRAEIALYKACRRALEGIS